MLCIGVAALFACSNPDSKKEADIPANRQNADLKEQLLDMNREDVRVENVQIESLVKRYGWKTESEKTGVRLVLQKMGNGNTAKNGQMASLEYTLRLIDGTKVYSSKEDGLKTFKIGSGGVESGLEEAILKLHVGDEAIIIIPSYRAYGLVGDGNKIPPRSTLIYQVKLLKLE